METEATKRYKEVSAECQTKLARLKVLMKEHQKEQKQHPSNWGYVGDIGHINNGLSELLEMMGNNGTS